MTEIWMDIPIYKGIYEASSLGRIRSKITNKLATPYLSEKGYLKVDIYLNGQLKRERVHRLVAMAFLPNPNNYPQVNHKDYVKTNNKVSNLEWCTDEYNQQYSLQHKNPKSVTCFGKRFNSIGECAKHYDIPRSTLSRWLNGRSTMPKEFIDGNLKFTNN